MAKAILVIGMPESCDRCDCCRNSYCYAPNVQDHDVVEYARSKTKPAWCPLKPMPERQDTAGETVASVKGYMVGWNAYIDAIEGKGKQAEEE